MSTQAGLWFLLYVFCSVSLAYGSLVNITIDDANTLISYGPSASSWNAQAGQECDGCQIAPDSHQTNHGTWHDTTFAPGDASFPPQTITFNFTGMVQHNKLCYERQRRNLHRHSNIYIWHTVPQFFQLENRSRLCVFYR